MTGRNADQQGEERGAGKNERRGRNKCLDLEGAREKGSSDSTMRLGRITTRKVQSLGAAAQRKAKHRDRGSGSQRPSGSLKIASMCARQDVHQDDHAEERLSVQRLRLTNQITTRAVVCLASDVQNQCQHVMRCRRRRTSLLCPCPRLANFQLLPSPSITTQRS